MIDFYCFRGCIIVLVFSEVWCCCVVFWGGVVVVVLVVILFVKVSDVVFYLF